MAQLLRPAHQPQPRISQLLPSVKCSLCSQPVPLDQLGDHTCAPAPPLPKPSPTSLLPTRLQNLVAGNPRALPPAAPPPKSPPPASPPPTQSVAQRRPSANERLRINTSPLRNAQTPVRSPLSRQHPDSAARTSTASSLSSIRSRTPSAASPTGPLPPTPLPAVRSRALSNASTRSAAIPPPPRSPFQPPPPRERAASHADVPARPLDRPYNLPPRAPELDTQSGGEAGMAGVGRRGFAAAARAAMFVTPSYPGLAPPDANARYLDISDAASIASRSTATPPLSSGSGYSSQSPGPHSLSPQSPHAPESAFGGRTSRSPSPSIPTIPLPAAKDALPEQPPTPRLPFFEKFRNKLPGLDTRPIDSPSDGRLPSSPRPPSPPARASSVSSPPARASTASAYSASVLSPRVQPASDALLSPTSDSEVGLAYADSTDDEEGSVSIRGAPVPVSILNAAAAAATNTSRVRFPSLSDRGEELRLGRRRGDSASSTGSGPRRRSGSGASAQSRSTGAAGLELAMETLLEGDMSDDESEGAAGRGSVGAALAKSRSVGGTTHRPPESRESRAPRLPTRSHTTPPHATTPHAGPSVVSPPKKRRVCVRCERRIEDGRWVAVDGGGVLCERCWKNMYLPKCRRCNLPIEKQAVSSADGQLKGKYHRACFNCATCQKPFPDRTFYVLDGRPLCAYHYHEANDSLCAAARCGQPIEGPCAVSHAGDRYHPEHLVCEAGACGTRLVEYWEVDGRMLCERHRDGVSDGDGDDAWAPSSRAMKRVTRFIDLAGAGGAGLM